MQILALEESLLQEKENFSQLQNVLEVERGRGKRGGPLKEDFMQQRLTNIYKDLEKERALRMSVENAAKTDDISKMIIQQLQKDLQYERGKCVSLDGFLAKEKQKYHDLYFEYEFLKGSSPSSVPEGKFKASDPRENANYLKEKNFELEKYTSELELKLDNVDREVRRLREEVESLEATLKEERAKNIAGVSKDQLSRMQQAESLVEFLGKG